MSVYRLYCDLICGSGKLDLKLLEIFVAVYRMRSVTRAAAELRIAQPTVSIALAKLRARFVDNLFVRTSGGMEPTPRATELFGPISDSLASLGAALRPNGAFVPAEAERRFRLCVSDSSQILLLPRLLDRLKTAAPGISLEIIPVASDTHRLLESGEVDLALGYLPQLEAGFYQQRLFDQRFMCMVRTKHPRIGSSLTRRQFLAESHVQIQQAGLGRLLEDAFAKAGLRLKIGLQLPTFLGVSYMVASTDLIVTVPELIARTVAVPPLQVRTVKPPIPISPYTVRQHWHQRFQRDPPNIWLRQTIADLFASPPLRQQVQTLAAHDKK